MFHLVLASASKRRSDILTSCGIKHEIIVSNAVEMQPRRKHIISSVMKNAERKVRAVAKTFSENEKNICIIGADTLVTFGNEVIGKPKDKHEAKALLRKFSGARLEVYTGLFLLMLKNQRQAQGYEKSSVKVKTIDQSKFEKYFLKLGPHDKAGGFSIEGAGSFVFDDIEGSYFNILGLPMTKLNELFAEIGLDLLDFCE